jgi:hypothetical protein
LYPSNKMSRRNGFSLLCAGGKKRGRARAGVEER